MRVLKKLHIALCTVFIFGFLGLLNFIPAQFEILDPIGKALQDFELTDLVFSELRTEQLPDTNVVLVNIGHLNRAQIGRQISNLAKHNPAVIGVDAFFRKRKSFDEDVQLIMAVNQANPIVMVSELVLPNEHGCFDSIATSHVQFNQFAENGFANMLTAAEGFKTTREFVPKNCVADTQELSFAAKLVSFYKPEKLNLLLDRQSETEVINWRGNHSKFFTLDALEVLNESTDLSFVKGKIVMLGYMGNRIGENSLEDTFYTPMNRQSGSKTFPDMYGVVVHANIVSMILNNAYINTLPNWLTVIIAILIVLANVTLFFWVGTHHKLYYDLITKTIQLVEVGIIFFLNLMILLYFELKIDLTIAMIALVFSGDLTELYVGSLKGMLENAWSKIASKFRKTTA